jgi:hypothetical protein
MCFQYLDPPIGQYLWTLNLDLLCLPSLSLCLVCQNSPTRSNVYTKNTIWPRVSTPVSYSWTSISIYYHCVNQQTYAICQNHNEVFNASPPACFGSVQLHEMIAWNHRMFYATRLSLIMDWWLRIFVGGDVLKLLLWLWRTVCICGDLIKVRIILKK